MKRGRSGPVVSAPMAAAIILLVTGVGFFLLPQAMIALGNISPWLAAALGVVCVLAFFAVFWLRARHQRDRDE